MMMWFDPLREAPYLGPPLTEQRRRIEQYYEGGAMDGTSEGEGGVPCEGGDAGDVADSEEVIAPGDSLELPF